LLLLIVLVQIGYIIFRFSTDHNAQSDFALDVSEQQKIDLLKTEAIKADAVKIFPFNPNFVSDYKGYALGMSINEIDRLHEFRASNKFVNSIEGFQKVTGVSDSLLNVLSPYLKFPEWTQKRTKNNPSGSPKKQFKQTKKQSVILIKDLNAATAQELKAINGVGEVLSARIVKFRSRLGGFLINEQLYDVYNLEPQVVQNILTKYKVFNKPAIEKININTASAYEISSLAYIKYDLAKRMVAYRLKNGPFTDLNELRNIGDFPQNKIERIALYLSL
jgi:DNA uptake protein ComE-like DNA-binding protein